MSLLFDVKKFSRLGMLLLYGHLKKFFFAKKEKKTDLGKFIPLSVNPTKCSNKLKQFVGCV